MKGYTSEDFIALFEAIAGRIEREKDHLCALDGLIGDAWFDLQASLPGEAVARWLDAPGERGDRLYAEISRRIQRLLRRFVPFLYFQDAARYRDLGSARPLLVYAALPVATTNRLRSVCLYSAVRLVITRTA